MALGLIFLEADEANERLESRRNEILADPNLTEEEKASRLRDIDDEIASNNRMMEHISRRYD